MNRMGERRETKLENEVKGVNWDKEGKRLALRDRDRVLQAES